MRRAAFAEEWLCRRPGWSASRSLQCWCSVWPVSPRVATCSAAPRHAGGPTVRPVLTSLGTPGDRLYPETGNGGYRSLHTNVDMVYDATVNRFLPGNRVELIDRATQCLTSFSLDFEPVSTDAVAGPNLVIGSVMV